MKQLNVIKNEAIKLIGSDIWALQIIKTGSKSGPHDYRICPVKLEITNISIGKHSVEITTDRMDNDLRWFFLGENGDGLFGLNRIGGRACQAFFDKTRLAKEAEIVKALILENDPHVGKLEVEVDG